MKNTPRILLALCALCVLASSSFAADNTVPPSTPVYIAKSTPIPTTIDAPTTVSTFVQLPSVSSATQYLNIPLIYEFSPKALGIVLRMQIGKITKFGLDIDTLAGAAAPTNSYVLGKSLANISGQAGFGVSGSYTIIPKQPYYIRAGLGVLETTGGQPLGSFYIMFGLH